MDTAHAADYVEAVNGVFHIVSTVIMVGWLIVGLLINNKIGGLRNEFLQDRMKVTSSLDKLHGVVQGHVDTDELQFKDLNRRLDKMERDGDDKLRRRY